MDLPPCMEAPKCIEALREAATPKPGAGSIAAFGRVQLTCVQQLRCVWEGRM